MSITLNLSPEVEARLRADALAQRVPMETLAAQAVEVFVLHPSSNTAPIPILPKGQRRAAIKAARGSMRGLLNSDQFLEEKHAEAQRELEKDEARRAARNAP